MIVMVVAAIVIILNCKGARGNLLPCNEGVPACLLTLQTAAASYRLPANTIHHCNPLCPRTVVEGELRTLRSVEPTLY